MPWLLDWGALCVLSPAFYYVGQFAQKLRLPLITGYMLGGVLCGPYGLNLLHDQALASFRLVEHTCLAVIAYAAGTELNISELRRTGRQVTSITLAISLFSWVLVYVVMLLLAPRLAFLASVQQQGAVNARTLIAAVASLAATISVARSPASAIAVLNEVRGKGAFCSLVMSVVVVKDVLTFVCFAVNVGMVSLVLEAVPSTSHPELQLITQPATSLFISALLGFVGNALLTTFLRVKKLLGQKEAALRWFKSCMLVMMSSCIFAAAELLRGEALLACVLMGVMSVNKRGEAASKEMLEGVEAALGRVMLGLQIVFFGLVGASLKLGAVFSSLWVALAVYAARLLGVYLGSWSGCWLGGAPPESRKRLWAGMVTQAGIALGLAKTVGTRFPLWGPDFAGVMTSVIIMNLMTGPIMFKAAVLSMGEARSSGGGSYQQHLDSGGGGPILTRNHKSHDRGMDGLLPIVASTSSDGSGGDGSAGGSKAAARARIGGQVELPAIVSAAAKAGGTSAAAAKA